MAEAHQCAPKSGNEEAYRFAYERYLVHAALDLQGQIFLIAGVHATFGMETFLLKRIGLPICFEAVAYKHQGAETRS